MKSRGRCAFRIERNKETSEVQLIGAPSIDWLGVPLNVRGKTIGVLVLQTYTEGVRFSDDDLQILVFVSTQVAMAIERKRAEEELKESRDQLEQRTSELEMVNKELESFSYTVSHDLKAPLRHIQGYSEILLGYHSDKLDKEGRGYLKSLRDSSRRMKRLIDDILRLSKAASEEIHRGEVDLSALAMNTVEYLQINDPDRKVEFGAEKNLKAEGDSSLLWVVLENLISNAWKFTAKRRKARIKFGQAEHGGKRAFFVRDNGAGFDMAYVEKLFTPFQRLHEEKEFKGSGIGLATVQRIIHRHGGRVWAEGKEGKGATFYFTLP